MAEGNQNARTKKMDIQVPKVVQDCHNLILWLIPVLDKFPRSRRFTLGERLENGLLKVLEDLVEAAYSQQKKPALNQANRQLEIVRHLWRLAYELKIISRHCYQHGAKLINEMDIWQYFPSIDHLLLKEKLRRRLKVIGTKEYPKDLNQTKVWTPASGFRSPNFSLGEMVHFFLPIT